MGDIRSKLNGSDYKHCPLCGVTTGIAHVVATHEARVAEVYQHLSDRNERIHTLQKQIAGLVAEVNALNKRVLPEGVARPSRADLVMLVDDLMARSKSFGIVDSDRCASPESAADAEREATDARTALLAALAMLTERES